MNFYTGLINKMSLKCCKCGRLIFLVEDQAKGVCKICDNFMRLEDEDK